jgi:predicted phosphate transport protein (TIGR00153 family)
MLGRLMPREGRFFDLFNQHADRIVDGSLHLVHLMQHYADPQARQRELDAIDRIETSADKITHETVALLHKTFVTPLDREDIHQLISRMDDILDLTQDVAESVMLYDIQQVTPEAIQLAMLSQMCCERVRSAVAMLSNMDNADPILKLCLEIDQLESDADRVMRAAMSKLFRDEADVRQVIKLKAIYELLESLTDKCEDVANIIEGVVLENA